MKMAYKFMTQKGNKYTIVVNSFFFYFYSNLNSFKYNNTYINGYSTNGARTKCQTHTDFSVVYCSI